MFLAAARPMNVEWKMRPYFGVFPLVFSALIHRTKSIYNTIFEGLHLVTMTKMEAKWGQKKKKKH